MMYHTDLIAIAVTGNQATTFLQGQLTVDINSLDHKPVLYSALCLANGRVIADLYVLRHGDDYRLICHQSLGDILVTRLNKFGQFSGITCTQLADPIAGHTVDGAGHIPISPHPLWLSFDQGSEPGWIDLEIEAGIPRITQATSGQFTAHMLSLDRLSAISVNKGCYVGQEIIARTHYRGQSKKILWRLNQPGLAPMDTWPIQGKSVIVISPGTQSALAVGSIDLQASEILSSC